MIQIHLEPRHLRHPDSDATERNGVCGAQFVPTSWDVEQVECHHCLLKVLKSLRDSCPLGWDAEGRMLKHRSTTEADVVAWLRKLHGQRP